MGEGLRLFAHLAEAHGHLAGHSWQENASALPEGDVPLGYHAHDGVVHTHESEAPPVATPPPVLDKHAAPMTGDVPEPPERPRIAEQQRSERFQSEVHEVETPPPIATG